MSKLPIGQMPSEEFDALMEDFVTQRSGQDDRLPDEYVRWAGEHRLMQRLQGKLRQLREIDYGDTRSE